MKIKYRDITLNPNISPWCVDCDLYKYAEIDTCNRVCGKKETFGGFNITDNCEVFEL